MGSGRLQLYNAHEKDAAQSQNATKARHFGRALSSNHRWLGV
jgi:hypothetical protein